MDAQVQLEATREEAEDRMMQEFIAAMGRSQVSLKINALRFSKQMWVVVSTNHHLWY